MKKLIFIMCILLASCNTYKIIAVQDYKKDANGKWQKFGIPHAAPDTITTVHAYIWLTGKRIYPAQ